MKIEIRADGLHISGYVNVTRKLSRPVVTPRGKVLETIEERAFDEANEDETKEFDRVEGEIKSLDATIKTEERAKGYDDFHAPIAI